MIEISPAEVMVLKKVEAYPNLYKCCESLKGCIYQYVCRELFQNLLAYRYEYSSMQSANRYTHVERHLNTVISVMNAPVLRDRHFDGSHQTKCECFYSEYHSEKLAEFIRLSKTKLMRKLGWYQLIMDTLEYAISDGIWRVVRLGRIKGARSADARIEDTVEATVAYNSFLHANSKAVINSAYYELALIAINQKERLEALIAIL